MDGLEFQALPPTPLGDGTFSDGAWILCGGLDRAIYNPSPEDPDVWEFAGWIKEDVPELDELEEISEILGPMAPLEDGAAILRDLDAIRHEQGG
jgi:hypothetical protein